MDLIKIPVAWVLLNVFKCGFSLALNLIQQVEISLGTLNICLIKVLISQFIQKLYCTVKTYLKNERYRSIPPEVFCKKDVFENFVKFSGKRAGFSFLIKLQAKPATLLKKDTTVQVFSSEFCKMFMNSFFIEHLRWLLLALAIEDIAFSIFHERLFVGYMFNHGLALKIPRKEF